MGLIFIFQFRYWNSRVPVIKSKIELKTDAKISIVLGSSHSFYGINSNVISGNWYNYASTSQGYYEDFYILKSLYDRSTIESVILPFSYFSNFFDLSRTPIEGESLRIFDYEKAYHIKYQHNLVYYKNKITILESIAGSVVRLSNVNGKFDYKGNLIENCSSIKYDLSDSADAFIRHNLNPNFEHRHPFLDSIINFCNCRNIQLYIIVFPFSSGYLNEIKNANPNFEQFLKGLKTFSINRFSFIDCRSFFPNDESIYFRNTDHLSPCGKDLFSKYLSDIIQKKK